MYNIEELNVRLLSELRQIAEEMGVKAYSKLTKKELIYKILDHHAVTPESDLPEKAKTAPALRKRTTESSKTEQKPRSENTPKPERKIEPKKTEATPKNSNASKKQNTNTNDAPPPNNSNNNNNKSRGNKRKQIRDFDGVIDNEGVLEIMQDGYGFLRSSDYNYLALSLIHI